MFYLLLAITITIIATATAQKMTPGQANEKMLFAAAAGQLATVREMLEEYGADVNAMQDSTGNSALMLAARENHPQLMQYLLLNGANANRRDHTGGTALFSAANNGFLEATNILLEASIDVNAMDMNYYTALHFAAFKGHERVVDVLMAQPEIDHTIISKQGHSPYMLVCTHPRAACEGERNWVMGHISDKLVCEGMAGRHFDCGPERPKPTKPIKFKVTPSSVEGEDVDLVPWVEGDEEEDVDTSEMQIIEDEHMEEIQVGSEEL